MLGALSYPKGPGVLWGLSYFFWRRLQGAPGDVVGVARRRVAGEAGFDATYLR